MILFADDESIRQEQMRIARPKKGQAVSDAELRRELIDDARELRAHARAREFAYLLFVMPVLVAIATALASFLVGLLTKS